MKTTDLQPDAVMDALCSSGDGVVIIDANKHIVRWNKAAETLLAFSEQEVLDRKCHSVFSGKTASGAIHCRPDCRIHSASANTPQKNFDLYTRTRDGEKICLNVSVFASRGTEDGFVAHILRDVTEQKRIESVLRRFLTDLGVSGRIRSAAEKAPTGSSHASGKAGAGTDGTQDKLSEREIEVLALLAGGLSTKALARKLDISPYTARNHIQNILIKLDLHSKTQAVSYAFKKGILRL